MNKKNVILSTIILLIAAISLILYSSYIIFYRKLAITEPTVLLTIAPGTGSHQIANTLTTRKIITHPLLFRLWARLQGLDRSIQAGDYLIDSQQTINSLISKMHQGQGVQHQVRFIEGWVFTDIMQALNKNNKLKHLIVEKPPQWIMAQLGHASQNPSGRFFPDTYNFSTGTSDLVILRRAYSKMQRVVHSLWARRAKGLPYQGSYQAIIMASLIEAEAAKASERTLIAGVLVNRLRKNMRLQVDPTVAYGLYQSLGIVLTRKDLRTDTPFNTYLYKGLPPTPICMPSYASLQAALHPATTNYYFYVAKPDGSHQFSKNYAQHKQAIAKYLLQQDD